MNSLALILYLAFGVGAFGWRSWVQWRRTGDAGFRFAAEPGTVQWWSKLGFITAIVAGLAAPVAGLLGLDPLPALDSDAVRVVGLVVAVLGIVATFWTQHQMGVSWRVGVDPEERTDLVTTGVFRIVRNPIFSAMLIAATGLALMVGNLVAAIGVVALVAALEAQVRLVEEPYLHAVHGGAYDRYAGAAGRFVPGVGRWRAR